MRCLSVRSRGGIVAVLVLTLLVAGCGENAPSPTATFEWPTALPASPTVNPVAPAEEGPLIRDPGQGMAGASSATEAGLAAEGEPDQQQATITPQPTQSELPVLVSAQDGLVLRGTLYGAPCAARARNFDAAPARPGSFVVE
jgi:hypothetical protein